MSQRADIFLSERGFYDSRAKAQEAISLGLVKANGKIVAKASEKIAANAVIQAEAPYPWVSRGGVKLEKALHVFGIDPADRHCLDIGSSTGGFCDVLLSRNAAHIIAVDVGTGQMHPRLAQDPRITLHEGTDARRLTADMLQKPPQLIVCDASFISIGLILPHILPLAAEKAHLITLIKPQFEVGRENIGKGGIVRDCEAQQAACDRIAKQIQERGWTILDLCPSPITGTDGNQEFLLGAYR